MLDDPKQFKILVEMSLQSRKQAFFVFEKNYDELHKKLFFASELSQLLYLFGEDNKEDLYKHIDEIIRLFHNFVSSAKTLVEINRIIMRRFEGTNLLVNYEEIIKNDFAQDPVVGFVEDIRNYCLHYSLPVSYASLSAKLIKETLETEFEYHFLLVNKSLRQWDGWTKKSEPLLFQSDEDIIINDICSYYYNKAKELHVWNIKEFQLLIE